MIFYIIFNIKSFLNVSRFQLSSVLGFQASCDVTTSHLYSGEHRNFLLSAGECENSLHVSNYEVWE